MVQWNGFFCLEIVLHTNQAQDNISRFVNMCECVSVGFVDAWKHYDLPRGPHILALRVSPPAGAPLLFSEYCTLGVFYSSIVSIAEYYYKEVSYYYSIVL